MTRTLRLSLNVAAALALGLSLGLSNVAMASDVKLGYVDVEQVFQKTEQGRKAIERWKKYRERAEKDAQAQLLPLKEALKAKVAEFQKQMEQMKPDMREKKQEMLQKEYRELMEKAQEFEKTAQQKYEEIMGPIQKKLEQVIYDIGIRDGYTMIFSKAEGIVLYATSKVDITEDVIREFNARK